MFRSVVSARRAAVLAVALAAAAFSFVVVAGLAGGLAPAFAAEPPPGEQILKDRFEGSFVRVKIDMPANQKGVDVWPAQSPSLDYQELARRIKLHGISLRRGDEVQVTKVKVKKDLIEFQLGGGGYGTFGDETGDVSTVSTGKSQREKNLEQDLKRTTDPAKRRQIEEELDDLRREREREDAAIRAEAAAESAARQEAIRSRAAEAGSRFNVRFRGAMPATAVEVQSLMDALDEFVEFDTDAEGGGPDAGDPGPVGVAALRKGLTRAEAEAALGVPTKSTPGKEGTLRVERAVFTTETELVDALFVEGVLVRYTVTSR